MELSESAGLAASFIVKSGAINGPFVLIDAGVRGGIHPRWRALEPLLEVYGFDPVAEVSSPNDRHHYSKIALGSHEGECAIYIPDNPYEARVCAEGTFKTRMTTLDALWSKGVLPPADFIKIDCEGYESEILKGASDYMAASDLLGADIETHFHVQPDLPQSHFAAINATLVEHRLRVADLVMQRARDSDQPWNGTCNVLFARHFLQEHGSEFPPSALLKTVAIFDIYGLVGPAIALVREFRSVLSAAVDTKALERMLPISAKAARLERRLPHLGLGIWTRVKTLLGRTRPH